ncbi:MAG: putative alkaline-shock protein, partial [Firmicutes bacterium]|nr:putative alkaline-shock protein [Bacillota bacterium]
IIGYGIKISEVALSVMQKVAYVLENGAGIPVEKVNVNVEGIKVIKDM